MIGFLLGTVCLIALVKVLRRSRGGRGFGYGCGSYGGGYGSRWGRHGHDDGWGSDAPPWARGGMGRGSFFVNAISSQLDATPAQEKVIRASIDEVRGAARSVRDELKGSRGDVAKAVRTDNFDEVVFGEMFHRHDVALEEFRKTVTGAIAKVHTVLDERQREKLADLVENGPRFFGRRGRPWGSDHHAV